MAEQPALDGRALVGGVVVEHQVDGQVQGHGGVQLRQKLLELLGAVVPTEAPHDVSRVVVEGGEQARRPVPRVIVAQPFGRAGEQQEDRLCPVQGLDLRLLIDAEDHRALGGIQIEPRGPCPRRTGP